MEVINVPKFDENDEATFIHNFERVCLPADTLCVIFKSSYLCDSRLENIKSTITWYQVISYHLWLSTQHCIHSSSCAIASAQLDFTTSCGITGTQYCS